MNQKVRRENTVRTLATYICLARIGVSIATRRILCNVEKVSILLHPLHARIFLKISKKSLSAKNSTSK